MWVCILLPCYKDKWVTMYFHWIIGSTNIFQYMGHVQTIELIYKTQSSQLVGQGLVLLQSALPDHHLSYLPLLLCLESYAFEFISNCGRNEPGQFLTFHDKGSKSSKSPGHPGYQKKQNKEEANHQNQKKHVSLIAGSSPILLSKRQSLSLLMF